MMDELSALAQSRYPGSIVRIDWTKNTPRTTNVVVRIFQGNAWKDGAVAATVTSAVECLLGRLRAS